MQQRKFLFIGGSREGVGTADTDQGTLTFVDGMPSVAGEPGDRPINATIEHYQRECVGDDAGTEGFYAYFLIGLESRECDARLAELLTKFTPAGDEIRSA